MAQLDACRTENQEVAGLTPALSWRLIMKYFLVILSLPLMQEGQLSVSGKRICTILVRGLSLPSQSVVRKTDYARQLTGP